MRRTAIGGEVCQQALSPLVSLPFVARAVAHDGRGVAHGDRCAALAAVASHVCRLPQEARRGTWWPLVLQPPTAPAPTIA
jgi:hypothetical protein